MGLRLPIIVFSAFLLVALEAPSWAKKSPEAMAFEEAVRSVEPPAKASKAKAKGVLGSGRMRKANRVAAEMVKKRLRSRGNDLELLSKAGAADIVIVAGTYDRAQDALGAMDIKHVVIRPRLVAKLDLMATQTLLINCPGNIGKEGRAKIESFVRRSGFLVTTDWALKNVVQRAFPGTIRHNGVETGDDVVKVQIHEHKKEELLDGIKLSQENPRWWLEGSSYPIKILDKKKVKVLMSSKQMGRRYGQSPIAVSFSHHDGKVLHMTSHFYLQRSKANKTKGSKLASAAGLTKKDLSDMKKRGIDADEVSAGEVNSAYSMQQLSSNILLSKQRANKKLLKKYDRKARQDIVLEKGRRGTKTKTLRKGFRVRVLETKGSEVKVQDLFGNEGWVDKDAL